MDFDETRLYYSHQDLQADNDDDGNDRDEGRENRRGRANAAAGDDDEDDGVDLHAVRRHFREFLRNYRLGTHRYVYREKLLRMHRRLSRSSAAEDASNESAAGGNDAEGGGGSSSAAAGGSGGGNNNTNANLAKLEVDLAHVGEYHASLLGHVLRRPAAMLPCLEAAAADALQTLLYDASAASASASADGGGGGTNPPPAPANMAAAPGLSVQVLLAGSLQPTALRSIKSEHMNRLLRCPGIVISSSPVKNRAVRMTLRCHRCLDTRTLLGSSEGPFASASLPPSCGGPDPPSCGRYPYAVVPDESRFVDQQTLKLQEAPERVPTGEMPRSVLLSVERSLVDTAPPGTRVHVLCIPTLLATSSSSSGPGAGGKGGGRGGEAKSVYLRVVGMVRDGNGAHGGGGQSATFTPAEEEAFQALARHPQAYSILWRSIAPNISGSYTVDIKKSLACQLFGGSRKKLPDGVRLRGDINVLLLGDPSMAKSQFLKFVSKVAPVGIYTSGKGSSAAGLTASVVRDAKGEFYLEGGAMVLADGGVVCIDEFDKMRPNDRVAIHEAMEQQTISIAKAGITTVLNSRSSVLAAANPVYGRYDDYRTASENIDLMTTILSRFDLIFLVRDVREEERDRMICQHVMGVHIRSSGSADGGLGHNSRGRHASAAGADASALSYRTAAPGPDESQDPSHGAPSMTPEAIAESVLRVVSSGEGELEVQAMKKYVQYAKARCSPRLGDDAGQVLASSYVKIREQVRRNGIDAAGDADGGPNGGAPAAIPITVRQLEALVRLSESLAKMRLDSEVRPEDVTEALRLFQVSTMAANAADQVNERSLRSGSAGPGPAGGGASSHRDELDRTEIFLRSRLQLGSLVNKQKLIEEAAGTGYNAAVVARAVAIMASRGEVLERNQGRLLKRIK